MSEFADRTAPVAPLRVATIGYVFTDFSDELFMRLVSDSLTTHVVHTVGVAERWALTTHFGTTTTWSFLSVSIAPSSSCWQELETLRWSQCDSAGCTYCLKSLIRKWQNCTLMHSVRSFDLCDISGLLREVSRVRCHFAQKIRAESSSNARKLRSSGLTPQKSELSSHQMARSAECWVHSAQNLHAELGLPRRGVRLIELRICRVFHGVWGAQIRTSAHFHFGPPGLLASAPRCILEVSELLWKWSPRQRVWRCRRSATSFVSDHACGRKGSSNLGLCGIWYISISSAKRRAWGCSLCGVLPKT